MRDYGQVQTKFWTNPETQGLSDQAKILFLYLLTGPHASALGCFRVPDGYVVDDLKWSREKVRETFRELSANGSGSVPKPFPNGSEIVSKGLTKDSETLSKGLNKGFLTPKKPLILRCEDTGWTLIPNFLKFNGPKNPNQGKALAVKFEDVPESVSIYPWFVGMLLEYPGHLPEQLINRLETLSAGFPNGFETVPEPLPKPFRNTETETETDTETEKRESAELRDSSPPALDESGSDSVVLTIPLIRKDGEFEVRQSYLDELAEAYPAVDTLALVKHIRQWNRDNPKKRKTKNGIRTHISTWFGKEQGKGSFGTFARQELKPKPGRRWSGADPGIVPAPETDDGLDHEAVAAYQAAQAGQGDSHGQA